jgi:hypothetical protein
MDRLRGQRLSEDADAAFAVRLLDTTEPRQPSSEARARVLAGVKRHRRRQPWSRSCCSSSRRRARCGGARW